MRARPINMTKIIAAAPNKKYGKFCSSVDVVGSGDGSGDGAGDGSGSSGVVALRYVSSLLHIT